MTEHPPLHGGAVDRMRLAFPDAPEPWLDLSTGVNPWPYPVDRPPMERFGHLPTLTERLACRAAMSTAFGASPDSVLVAPGTELLIRLLPGLLPTVRRVAVLSPGYGDHVASWRAAGRQVVEVSDPLSAPSDCDAIVLSNPNNPDGRAWSAASLMDLLRRLSERGGLLVIDEAYADCVPERSVASLAGAPGLVVLRSFGKFYGLAGVRLGALLAPDDLIKRAEALFGCWPVNGPALWLGARAYADLAWQAATRARLAEAAVALDAVLTAAGLEVVGGTPLFRFVVARDAERAWRALASRGVYVRRFAWSGRHLRFGLAPDAASLDRLAAALSP